MAVKLTQLERAALDQFGSIYAHEVGDLAAQLQHATVASRENTGGGFFTDLMIDRALARPVFCPSPLDNLMVRVDGMVGELEFLLFFRDGYAYLLEAYAIQGDDTAGIDFETAAFGPITFGQSTKAT